MTRDRSPKAHFDPYGYRYAACGYRLIGGESMPIPGVNSRASKGIGTGCPLDVTCGLCRQTAHFREFLPLYWTAIALIAREEP